MSLTLTYHLKESRSTYLDPVLLFSNTRAFPSSVVTQFNKLDHQVSPINLFPYFVPCTMDPLEGTHLFNDSHLPHNFWNNQTFEPSENVTSNSTNTTTVEWLYPLPFCIYLITDACIFTTWAVTANLLVIYSFFTDAKLRVVQNYYIVSLACSDLLMGAFSVPLGCYSFLYKLGWPIGNKALCKWWLLEDYVSCLQGSLTICLISYDRYKMVLHPIAYRNEETSKRAISRIALCWCFSILFYGPIVLFWDVVQGYSIVEPGTCDVEFRDIAWLTLTQACVEFAVPLVIICYCNFRLLFYIRQRRKRMLEIRKTMEANGQHTDNTTLDKDSQSQSAAVSTVQNQHHGYSMRAKKPANAKKNDKNSAELAEIKKEQRATRSLMVLVGTFFCLWFFYEIVGNFADPICKCIPTDLYIASYWPLYHIASVDPIIYAVTIERFRYHFKKFFSRLLPCCIRPPGEETSKKNRIAPSSHAAVHSVSKASKH